MDRIAVFDIGTSAVKGLLMRKNGAVDAERSIPVTTREPGDGRIEQNPEEWWAGVKTITDDWFYRLRISPETIQMVTLTGQMEDVIFIGEDGTADRAILYSDMRAAEEAAWIREELPELAGITSNAAAASTPAAKLRQLALQGEAAATVVFSAKDYIIYKLTGAVCTDTVTAATTGLMDIRRKAWHPNVLEALGADRFALPRLHEPDDTAGVVTDGMPAGLASGTPVLCGAGDAGSATMGAGAVQERDSYFYIGTTGWTAVPVQEPDAASDGVFTLPHLVPDRYIAIAPLLNAGSVYDWAKQIYMPDDSYDAFHETIAAARPGAGGVLFLPYLHGERFPVQDSGLSGTYYSIRPDTTRDDMMRAVVEGLTFSLRYIAESLTGGVPGSITLIGGGTRSSAWCRILADITGQKVRVPEESGYLTALGTAATAFCSLGWSSGYEAFADDHLYPRAAEVYEPNPDVRALYDEAYAVFLKTSPAVRRDLSKRNPGEWV
ncbi:xylulokinase [Salibacterium qingdaonense]|uniref:Xylulokinase n=1 Tax=Salibacterium qingdaonense TaxID=266892 RepID=A0A1I4PN63_9BACI|nr:FGGY family carbohydrate kinase [Salibacterium qingdaonense]SFM29227.1 xylulokinase [Salibacterium qingdaonense]